MSNTEIKLNDEQFEVLVAQALPEDLPDEVRSAPLPYRKALMECVVGVALILIDIRINILGQILSLIGTLLVLLAFRTLKDTEKSFRIGYAAALILAVFRAARLILCASYFNSVIEEYDHIPSNIIVILNLLILFSLWLGTAHLRAAGGIEASARPAGALIVYYIILLGIGLLGGARGILAVLLVIVYIAVLISLYRFIRQLDESLYAAESRPHKFTNRALAITYVCLIAVGIIAVGLLLGRYPSASEEFVTPSDVQSVEIKKNLAKLGFPRQYLDDLKQEDIESCRDALRVISDSDVQSVSEGENIILTSVAVEITENRDRVTGLRWVMFFFYEYSEDPRVRGNDCVDVFNTEKGWTSLGEDLKGHLLYEKDGKTWSIPYYYVGPRIIKNIKVLHMPDEYWPFDGRAYAVFSLPAEGSRIRGYVKYYMMSNYNETMGFYLGSWHEYTHQTSRSEYPKKYPFDYIVDGSWPGSNDYFHTSVFTGILFNPWTGTAD